MYFTRLGSSSFVVGSVSVRITTLHAFIIFFLCFRRSIPVVRSPRSLRRCARYHILLVLALAPRPLPLPRQGAAHQEPRVRTDAGGDIHQRVRRQQSTGGNIIRIVLLLNTEPRGQCLVMERKCLPSPWAASPRLPLRPTRDHPRASGQEEGGAAAGGGTGRQGGLGK